MTSLRDLSPESQRLLAQQSIELASWAFGNAGTRFKVFTTPGTPRDPFEKIADAAQVHKYTGITPRVSLHIPWDEVQDFAALARYADEQGIQIGNVNSNVFQGDQYKFGSLTNFDRAIRRQAIDEHKRCIEAMNQTGS